MFRERWALRVVCELGSIAIAVKGRIEREEREGVNELMYSYKICVHVGSTFLLGRFEILNSL